MTLKKIILHWSAGAPIPNAIDLMHYHFVVDSIGRVHNGKYAPEDNINCYDGAYAAHTGGGNTGSIGVALSGMMGFKNPKEPYKFPITKRQLEACFYFTAELCREYEIAINSKNILTHYEFGIKNPTTTSSGKIDIIHLPPYAEVKANEVGDFMREKINWYFEKND